MLFELRHPGLPWVIDHLMVEGQGHVLVMDYIEGDDGREILEKRDAPLDEETVVDWARQILPALRYLHSRQLPVIHRDVKPANIKITLGGQAILLDFGLAKEYDPPKAPRLARAPSLRALLRPSNMGRGVPIRAPMFTHSEPRSTTW